MAEAQEILLRLAILGAAAGLFQCNGETERSGCAKRPTDHTDSGYNGGPPHEVFREWTTIYFPLGGSIAIMTMGHLPYTPSYCQGSIVAWAEGASTPAPPLSGAAVLIVPMPSTHYSML